MIQFLSLFSGIGAFEKALDKLGVPYELVNYCEIDKYASKSYSVVHDVPEWLNLGDITKVDTSKLPPIDIVSYGFPCQDISLAGKQKGLFNEDGELTRSGLFFEALRIIEDTKPKVAIAENVKNLTGKKFTEQFDIVLSSLEEAGYNNYWQVLNAKDYGVPQNRERVFIVSIRKDIDNGCFKFPEPFELELRLKDLLESEVDEKYYLSKQFDFIESAELKTEPVRLGNIYGEQFGTGYAGNVWDKNGVSPTLMTMQGGGRQPHVIVKENTKTRTISPQQGAVTNNLRIRKLTPLECWRLMGFDDEDYYKAEKVNSNTQLYKQAGNSIVVDVLVYLFKEILEAVEMKKVDDKVVVYECDKLINLEALKENEPELYEELVADYPSEKATYVFKVVS